MLVPVIAPFSILLIVRGGMLDESLVCVALGLDVGLQIGQPKVVLGTHHHHMGIELGLGIALPDESLIGHLLLGLVEHVVTWQQLVLLHLSLLVLKIIAILRRNSWTVLHVHFLGVPHLGPTHISASMKVLHRIDIPLRVHEHRAAVMEPSLII